MRILVVEDDDRIADFLIRALKSERHTCIRCADGKEGLELGRQADFELILLDIMLPNISGMEICQELRLRKIATPIIMLTAMDGVDDIITGLKMGADDYLTKPFVIDELLARIEAVARRRIANNSDKPDLVVGDVVMNSQSMHVTAAGKTVELTAKELAVLELLMANPDRLFSRERILNNIWGMSVDPLTNVVDVYIGRLRKKLGKDNTPFIETVRGMGYRIHPSA
ncbi:MAG: response regulator transcription factor [Gammaproteobacteria bacterium]|nr:response regulator transcription factor [Gammaproteobacteria bacterium]